ncbi:MAG: hypothetical protein OXB84_09050 [Halobacteriovoraceae bacterium]|nr:hypothetical protein [Halobacteriovoraceae bacterium]
MFIVSSIFYWHILQSIDKGQSALDRDLLILFMKDNIPLILLMIFTAISVWRIKKWSIIPFIIFVTWNSINCISVFFYSMDKLILILGFVYSVCAFYFYLFLKIELQEVVYCPGHSPNSLGKKAELDFDVLMEFEEGKKINGHLSNWGANGCFVVLKEKMAIKKRLVTLYIEFEGQKFKQKGEIATSYGHGIGVRLLQKMDILEKYGQSWKDLYRIIRDRGYRPQNVRTL